MKALLLLPTGIADVPLASLQGQTPLAAARTPHLDAVAREGRLGLVRQVPEGLRIGSESAVLSTLGYDPRRERVGRGGLEAAGLGVELGPDDLALRLNLVSTFREHLIDFRAGRIRSEEAGALVAALQDALGDERTSFHAGLGYRNLLVLRGGAGLCFETVSPPEVQGHELARHLPYGPDGGLLVELMERAARVLADHDVNRVRLDLGENPADRIWLWGPGRRAELEPFALRTGLSLAVVAAVPLVRGLGAAVEARVLDVPGATGSEDTDLDAKREAALAALEEHDVVLLHVAAVTEACHEADVRLKVAVLEELDRRLVGPLLAALRARGDVRLLVTTDHMTSVLVNQGPTTHVPFAVWGPGVHGRRLVRYTEEDAAGGDLCVEDGHQLLEFLLKGSLAGARETR